jgi:hypothetical protein
MAKLFASILIQNMDDNTVEQLNRRRKAYQKSRLQQHLVDF